MDVLSAPDESSGSHPSSHNVLDRVNEVERVLAAALRAGKPWWAEDQQKEKKNGLQSFELEGVYKRLNSLEDMINGVMKTRDQVETTSKHMTYMQDRMSELERLVGQTPKEPKQPKQTKDAVRVMVELTTRVENAVRENAALRNDLDELKAKSSADVSTMRSVHEERANAERKDSDAHAQIKVVAQSGACLPWLAKPSSAHHI